LRIGRQIWLQRRLLIFMHFSMWPAIRTSTLLISKEFEHCKKNNHSRFLFSSLQAHSENVQDFAWFNFSNLFTKYIYFYLCKYYSCDSSKTKLRIKHIDIYNSHQGKLIQFSKNVCFAISNYKISSIMVFIHYKKNHLGDWFWTITLQSSSLWLCHKPSRRIIIVWLIKRESRSEVSRSSTFINCYGYLMIDIFIFTFTIYNTFM
jgi:hypothetical protein